MSPSFGTSGLRGLVTDLTPDLVAGYTRAFLASCPHGGTVYVGRDLRPSSPDIAGSVIAAVRGAGLACVDCGAVPTPALAMAAMAAGAAAIMVTGSHIPADRNGLKFYLPTGEVSKADEARILAARATQEGFAPATAGAGQGRLARDGTVNARYRDRYVAAFGPEALAGLTLGVYRHSSVARDVMTETFEALGARTVPLAHSEAFVPVDTEAVDADTRAMLRDWCARHGLDAVVSTDGDADRPMLTDAAGTVIPGDVLGVLTARHLGARIVCTPVSSNDMVRRIPDFDAVRLTRIGSPFVIAEMEQVLTEDPEARVVGFEANGGFLLGFAAGLAGPLAPLMTRDCLLPVIAPLAAAQAAGGSVADLVAELPPCFTAADRVKEIDRDKAAGFLADLVAEAGAREAFFAAEGPIAGVDLTDGLRLDFADGSVTHLRPSGNAPEFRVYAQADSAEAARARVEAVMDRVAARVR
ncbi:phosphomannomutase [Celeribacter indicus]|uniref:Phosphomannomutase n=1 Tax=Celeribacter indicus TaxID=1208324 RepID=A0A0B5E159_9RHOB|nr:phosphomannomutase [Celeribacter indicus]AJE46162.1 phosphomannomutase [Celeribacter indicus]SDX36523.1 phosphomannomutase [Celeribacter indicus]